MPMLTRRTLWFLLFDIAFLVIALTNLPSVIHRAGAPFDAASKDERVIVSRILSVPACGDIAIGDELASWNGKPIVMPGMVEYFGDFSTVGTPIAIGYFRDARPRSTVVTLIPFYDSPRYVIIVAVVGIIMWLVGAIILLARPGDLAASTLHWALLFLSGAILMTWGVTPQGKTLSYVHRGLLLASFGMAGPAYFFFTTLFPRPRFGPAKRKALIIFVPPLLIAAWQISCYVRAQNSGSSADFLTFQAVTDVFRFVMLLFGAGTMLNILRSYLLAQSGEEKKKMQWVLWGFIVGGLPVLVLFELPQLFLPAGLVPEEFTTIFLVAIPFSLAISFLRYRLLDIEIVINRSILYVALTLLVGAVYAISGLLITSEIGGTKIFGEYLPVILVSLAVGLFFNPVRLRLQHYIDEAIFPTRVHFQKRLKAAAYKMHSALTEADVYSSLVEDSAGVVPSDSFAVYSRIEEGLVLRQFRGLRPPERLKVESFLAEVHGDDEVRIPLEGGSHESLGLLVVRPKTRGEKFGIEEIDWLNAVSSQAGEALERLRMQEKMLFEREEREKIEELDRLKSYFVASVSHELRTPLTSIRMFAETLRAGKTRSDRVRRDYLRIIEGESDRLSRLIENILGFSRLERGIKGYSFSDVDVGAIVRRALDAMKYQFGLEGVKRKVSIPRSLRIVRGDPDALEQVVINLLTNALKYSPGKKVVDVRVLQKRDGTVIEVADRGMGIPREEIPKIFEPFYRAHREESSQVGGTGLGLALVRHAIDAHHGSISVKSTLGRGTTFSVFLPFGRPFERKRKHT